MKKLIGKMATTKHICFVSGLAAIFCVALHALPPGSQNQRPGVQEGTGGAGQSDVRQAPPRPGVMDMRETDGRPRPDMRVALASLPAEKQDQYRQMVYSIEMKRIELKAETAQAELQLQHLLDQNEIDDKAVLKAVDDLNETRGDLLRQETEHYLAKRRLLGEELAGEFRPGPPPTDRQDQNGFHGRPMHPGHLPQPMGQYNGYSPGSGQNNRAFGPPSGQPRGNL